MTQKKKDSSPPVSEKMLIMIEEIKLLVKVREALSYGTKSHCREKAESVMSRRINNRVNTLSEHILETFGKEE